MIGTHVSPRRLAERLRVAAPQWHEQILTEALQEEAAAARIRGREVSLGDVRAQLVTRGDAISANAGDDLRRSAQVDGVRIAIEILDQVKTG